MTIKDVLQMREAIATYYAAEFHKGAIITNPADIAHFAAATFGGSRVEHIWAFLLDGSHCVKQWKEFSKGTVDTAPLSVRELARWALLQDAVAVVLVHNHPSGKLAFSGADNTLTLAVKAALKLFQIKLLDHLIVAPDGAFTSAQETGML